MEDKHMYDQKEPQIQSIEKDGIKVELLRRDPFGLIYFNVDNITLPLEFSGEYTDLSLAQVDAHRLLNTLIELKEDILKNTKKKKAS